MKRFLLAAALSLTAAPVCASEVAPDLSVPVIALQTKACVGLVQLPNESSSTTADCDEISFSTNGRSSNVRFYMGNASVTYVFAPGSNGHVYSIVYTSNNVKPTALDVNGLCRVKEDKIFCSAADRNGLELGHAATPYTGLPQLKNLTR
jgi:hypothetical protein